ncbi:MAG TPA: glycosyltransferase family 4 protein [Pirellulaceae bacterium]|nr:glycosyltransferase family 4 protein [Pirellulaceae bacterium]
MKVLHVITRMIVGGAQENTLYNCLDLMRLYGDDVLLATGPSKGPEGALLEQARADHLAVRVVPHLCRAISPPRDARAYAELKRTIEEFRPDVVHTHSAKGGILGRLAGWKLSVPCVVHTVHGAPFYPYQPAPVRTFYRWCETYAAKRCHALISVADAMTDQLVAAGVAPREKFVTIRSGMEVEPFLKAREKRDAMRARLGIAPDEVVVAKIARLFALKGHEDVIHAARTVLASHPRTRFLFIGDGTLRSQHEAKLRELGLSDRFLFVGLVPPDQIPDHLAAADLLVHASYREGLARALPQALLTGIPAISYDVDGAREVVLSGETGELVAPGDIAGLAAAIAKLVADSDLRERQGRAGQARCAEPFDRETMTRQIRELYDDVLAGRFPQQR